MLLKIWLSSDDLDFEQAYGASCLLVRVGNACANESYLF